MDELAAWTVEADQASCSDEVTDSAAGSAIHGFGVTADGKGSHTACPIARTPRAGKATDGRTVAQPGGRSQVDVLQCGLGLVDEEHPLGQPSSWRRRC